MISLLKKMISLFNRSRTGVCSICNEEFPDTKLHIGHDIPFCQRDFKELQENEWIIVKVVESNPDDPSQALLLTNLKFQLRDLSIPSFITTDYTDKSDTIITIFRLHIKSSDKDDYDDKVNSLLSN